MKKTPILRLGRRPSSMSPAELQSGRLMRGPDDHPTGTQQEGTNNGGGNSTPPTGESESQNNTGNELDLEQFWAPEDGENGAAPKRESDDDSGSSSSISDTDLATNLRDGIAAANFGDVMTPEIYTSLQSGDPVAFNTGIQDFGRAIMSQTMGQSIAVMRVLRERILGEVNQMIEGRVTGDKDHDELIRAIPSAGSAAMGPTIKNVYKQALTRTKGDRTKAIEMTKDVLRIQAENFGSDLNLNVAPRSPDDRMIEQPKKTNWLEELSGR